MFLSLLSGSHNGRVLKIEREGVIGRDPAVEYSIDDPTVSRRHAELVRSADGWRLRDLGSANGTEINGAGEYRSDTAAGRTAAPGPGTGQRDAGWLARRASRRRVTGRRGAGGNDQGHPRCRARQRGGLACRQAAGAGAGGCRGFPRHAIPGALGIEIRAEGRLGVDRRGMPHPRPVAGAARGCTVHRRAGRSPGGLAAGRAGCRRHPP
ncbi:MAG: FHA domain-containing protein [Rhodanobacteraceae bacterium]|nr:FHA domain-containing protein [Rhodanobacteraceae bacterium]